jgi:hypothetical protein
MTDLERELRQGSLNNDDYRWKAAARIEQLEAALQEISTYEIEDGCPCNACQHSAIARAALEEPK